MMSRKYVGKSIKRFEDGRLLRGNGCYIADMKIPNMCHQAVLRSIYPHSKIKKIDTNAALKYPGVIDVLTGEQASKLAKPLSPKMLTPGLKPLSYYCLPTYKTSYVGEPVAVVCAEDPYTAVDALELIEVEYDPLAPLVNAEEAMKPSSPLLYEDWGDNEFFTLSFENGDVDSAFKMPDYTFQEKLEIHRLTVAPMETRGCIAAYDTRERALTLWSSTQFPHILRFLLAESLGMSETRVRVVAPDIGGGFGSKLSLWPEELAACLMSMKLGRPVRWIEDRSENLMAGNHSREQVSYVEFAMKKDLTISGIKLRSVMDVGCAKYAPWPSAAMSVVSASTIPGVYKVQDYRYDIHCIVTNKAPQGAYRGFGEPEGAFIMDRMIDIVARELNVDPAEVRFKNLIRPEDYPYVTATGLVIESGSHTESLRKALEIIDYERVKQQRAELRKAGRYIGLGISCGMKGSDANDYLVTGMMQAYDQATVKIDLDGKATALVGVSEIGQGLVTSLSQVLADELGALLEDVTIVQGDTDRCPFGFGAWASRGSVAGGGAVMMAARKVRENILKIASKLLDADTTDLAIAESRVFVRARPERALSLKDIARVAYVDTFKLPNGFSGALEATERYDAQKGEGFVTDEKGRANFCSNYPHAAHVALVEVDIETGKVQPLRYVVVYDCGRAINPMIVEGQAHGALVQGIGGAIYEEMVYGQDGQLLTSTFMDYLLPTSSEIPEVEVYRIETPSPKTLGGFKGVGEVNIVPVSAALTNAVEDALSPLGVRVTRTPLSPMNVWQMLRKRQSAMTATLR